MRKKVALILSFLFLINPFDLNSAFALNIESCSGSGLVLDEYDLDWYWEEETRLYRTKEQIDKEGRKKIFVKFKRGCRKEIFEYFMKFLNKKFFHFERAHARRIIIPPGYDKEDPTGTTEEIKKQTMSRLSGSRSVKSYEYVPNFTEHKNYAIYPTLNETKNLFNRFFNR